MSGLEYLCDQKRHLICRPYSVENLHRMARELGINRAWFHRTVAPDGFPLYHYDIPAMRVAEITAKCRIVSSRDIVGIMRSVK